MRLSELVLYKKITIQCHDNPDADAIASAYGLFCYFQKQGIVTRIVYSGACRIQKSNLILMIEKLNIIIEYVEPEEKLLPEELLITVDCQHGAGNVTKIISEQVAIIDHHTKEVKNIPLSRIESNLGSCATLVWSMLREENYHVNDDVTLGTALYYGLYTDTNQFSEIYHPLDMDLRDTIKVNKRAVTLFRNSNLTLKELEIAGIAMIGYDFNEEYQFAVIKAAPCDPNILGLISDFLLQVDKIDVCIVYNEVSEGYKISVRSCIKEVNANELASFLTAGIGSGGGHNVKAGGFISLKSFHHYYATLSSDVYFKNRMIDYFDSFFIIDASEYKINYEKMKLYKKVPKRIGCMDVDKFVGVDGKLTLRTEEGDYEIRGGKNQFITIDELGRLHAFDKRDFEKFYDIIEEKFVIDNEIAKYIPTIRINHEIYTLKELEYSCIANGKMSIYMCYLEHGVKIFANWLAEKYELGRPGDYMALYTHREGSLHIVKKEEFHGNYIEVMDY